MDRERLRKLLRAVGKERLVLDLSCRKKVNLTMICRTCKKRGVRLQAQLKKEGDHNHAKHGFCRDGERLVAFELLRVWGRGTDPKFGSIQRFGLVQSSMLASLFNFVVTDFWQIITSKLH